MFTDSHCHIEDDATAFRAGEAGVGVILNAGKDLDLSRTFRCYDTLLCNSSH